MLQILPKIHNIERTGRKRCRFWRWPAQLPLFRLLLPVAMGLTWAAQAAPGPVNSDRFAGAGSAYLSRSRRTGFFVSEREWRRWWWQWIRSGRRESDVHWLPRV